MEDFANLLHRDYGLKPGGKSAPMAGSHSRAGSSGGRSGSAYNDDVFSSAFGSMSVNDNRCVPTVPTVRSSSRIRYGSD